MNAVAGFSLYASCPTGFSSVYEDWRPVPSPSVTYDVKGIDELVDALLEHFIPLLTSGAGSLLDTCQMQVQMLRSRYALRPIEDVEHPTWLDILINDIFELLLQEAPEEDDDVPTFYAASLAIDTIVRASRLLPSNIPEAEVNPYDGGGLRIEWRLLSRWVRLVVAPSEEMLSYIYYSSEREKRDVELSSESLADRLGWMQRNE